MAVMSDENKPKVSGMEEGSKWTPADSGTANASPGITLDVDGDGETTATVKDGVWVAGEPSLVRILKLRQQYTGLQSDDTLIADAKEYLQLGDDR
jgi:hypothetical protein